MSRKNSSIEYFDCAPDEIIYEVHGGECAGTRVRISAVAILDCQPNADDDSLRDLSVSFDLTFLAGEQSPAIVRLSEDIIAEHMLAGTLILGGAVRH